MKVIRTHSRLFPGDGEIDSVVIYAQDEAGRWWGTSMDVCRGCTWNFPHYLIEEFLQESHAGSPFVPKFYQIEISV